MNMLALDIATSTGWAKLSAGALESGVKKFPKEGGSVGYYLYSWSRWLHMNIDDAKIEFVAYEYIDFEIKDQEWNKQYNRMLGVLMCVCEGRRVKYQGFSVRDIKRSGTGKGGASKIAMVRAAREQWPDQRITSDDQADALWVMYLACQKLDVPQPKHVGELF